MNREPDLGEQALDKAVEFALTSQLDKIEQVDIDIRTNPGKLVQGQVDSVSLTGEGMVMKQDLRVESAEIHTDSVAINPLKAVFGEIEFTQPTNAKTEILLTEADLNRALASNYLQGKMKNLKVESQGQSTTVDIKQISLHLLDSDQIKLDADFYVFENGKSHTNEDESDTTRMDRNKHFSAIVRPFLEDDGQRINFEVLSAEGQGLSLTFITDLFEQIVKLLDLRNFELEGWTLQLTNLDIQEGQLFIQAATTIEKLSKNRN